MLINFNTVNYYYLTCDTNSDRAKHIREEFKDYNITEINPKIGNGFHKFKSGASGHLRMIDQGLKNQERNKLFQPFVLLEDDVSIATKLDTLEIPDDTDLLYIGISPCGIKDTKNMCGTYNLYYKNIDDNLVKIYNMLSNHGIMICSTLGASVLQKALLEAYYKNKHYDLFIATIQPYYNIYAMKLPFVFQDPKYGGVFDGKGGTNISLQNKEDIPIPQECIYSNTDSIIISNI